MDQNAKSFIPFNYQSFKLKQRTARLISGELYQGCFELVKTSPIKDSERYSYC